MALLLCLAMPSEAVELKVRIQPRQLKEFFVTVNGLTKTTINQETSFDVPEGATVIEIGKKKIRKLVTKPSILEVFHFESDQ